MLTIDFRKLGLKKGDKILDVSIAKIISTLVLSAIKLVVPNRTKKLIINRKNKFFIFPSLLYHFL